MYLAAVVEYLADELNFHCVCATSIPFHYSVSLLLGMLGVGDSITDDILKEDLQNSTGLFIDETRDTLHSTTMRQMAGLVNLLLVLVPGWVVCVVRFWTVLDVHDVLSSTYSCPGCVSILVVSAVDLHGSNGPPHLVASEQLLVTSSSSYRHSAHARRARVHPC